MRARQMDLTTGEGKQRALNFLLPYIQKIPNSILRSEWATRIAQQLRIDEPLLRSALTKAAKERRAEIKTSPELAGRAAKEVERRLIRMLAEDEEIRRELAERLRSEALYLGLETEKIFAALIVASLSDSPVNITEIASLLEERDRRILFEILFEPSQEFKWKEANSCLQKLRLWKTLAELSSVQREIERESQEAGNFAPRVLELHERKLELSKAVAKLETEIDSSGSPDEEEQDEVLDDVKRMIKESQQKYCRPDR
jgi:DNA primase